MEPKEILAALILKGVKQTEIANKAKVARSLVSQVIHGRCKSRRIQEEIAKVIDKDVDEVWPQWAA